MSKKDYETEFIHEIKKLTRLINFDCHCHNVKKFVIVGNQREQKEVDGIGCCEGCFHSLGYGALNENNIDKFDNAFGFWREGKGCILEPEDRALLCLLYHCKPLSKEDFDITAIVSKSVHDIGMPVAESKPVRDFLGSIGYGDSNMPLKKSVIFENNVRYKYNLNWPSKVDKSTRRRILRLRNLALEQRGT